MKLDKILIGNNFFYFRDGTSDSLLLKNNLLCDWKDRDYKFPNIKPKVIFDIGSNIGATSVLLANLYPEATIYSFEPEKENFELLQKNTANYKNMNIFNIGLSNESKTLKLFKSDTDLNFGGYSIYEDGCDTSTFSEVVISDINSVIDDLGIKEIDLIKIDCEGAEYSILSNLKILNKTKFICGEMHNKDGFKLLNILSENFHVEVKKNLLDRNYNFSLLNKEFHSAQNR